MKVPTPIERGSEPRRAVIIGCGARGRLHAELLSEIGYACFFVTERQDAPGPSGPTLDAAAAAGFSDPDYWVVAKPTRAHAVWLSAVLARGGDAPVLVETPLFDTSEDLVVLERSALRRIAVGCQARFSAVVAKLLALVGEALAGGGRIERARFVGAAPASMRAGPGLFGLRGDGRRERDVLRALSHEIDLSILFLGGWRRATALGGSGASLVSGWDDCVEILAETDRCPLVSIQLVCQDGAPQRRIELGLREGDRSTIWTADASQGRIWRDGALVADLGPEDPRASVSALHLAAAEGCRAERLCRLGDAVAALSMIDAASASLRTPQWIVSPVSAARTTVEPPEPAVMGPQAGWPEAVEARSADRAEPRAHSGLNA